MRKFGKLALLLVVIGWFCPVACNLTGPQWAQVIFDSNGEMSAMLICAIGLLLSMVFAAIGILIVLVNWANPNGSENVTTVLSMLCGAPFFIYLIANGSVELLSFGAYLMIAGWVLSILSALIFGKNNTSS